MSCCASVFIAPPTSSVASPPGVVPDFRAWKLCPNPGPSFGLEHLGQELLEAAAGGCLEELLGRLGLDDPAAVHEVDRVGHPPTKAHPGGPRGIVQAFPGPSGIGARTPLTSSGSSAE